MTRVRTVNLLWQHTLRGASPVSQHAMDDFGTVAVVAPRPYEARTYELVHIGKGGAAPRTAFTAEKFLRAEASAGLDDVAIMTPDRVYLFHTGAKTRLTADRRLSLIDIAMSETGPRVAAIYADLSGANSVALAEMNGEIRWTRDLPGALSAVAVSTEGNRVAVGSDDGVVRALDASGRECWRFAIDEPVYALACSADGARTIYGTATGAIGCLDAGGGREWATTTDGPIRRIGSSANGGFCVALASRPDDMTRILCIGEGGVIDWQHDAGVVLIGVCVAPDGKTFATGSRGAELSAYECVFSATSQVEGTNDSDRDVLAAARARAESGDETSAMELLQKALDTDVANVEACRLLVDVRAAWMAQRMSAARESAAGGHLDEAIAILERVVSMTPRDPQAVELLSEIEQRRVEQLATQARASLDNGDPTAAEAALRTAVRVAPLVPALRAELRSVHEMLAASSDAAAERLHSGGDFDGAVTEMENACAWAPTNARRESLQRELTNREFAAGLASYEAGRYEEAVFEFKKTIARDPGHARAKRYLTYAEKALMTTAGRDVAGRFKRLE